MAKVMWKFKTKHFTVRWIIEPDVLDTFGMDAALAAECRSKVRSGDWECFSSEIRVTANANKMIVGEAYLGNSIYEKPEEFRDHFGMNQKGYGSYFSQMVREAVREARRNFAGLQSQAEAEIADRKKLLSIHLRSAEKLTRSPAMA